jgi:hypothetical protein
MRNTIQFRQRILIYYNHSKQKLIPTGAAHYMVIYKQKIYIFETKLAKDKSLGNKSTKEICHIIDIPSI